MIYSFFTGNRSNLIDELNAWFFLIWFYMMIVYGDPIIGRFKIYSNADLIQITILIVIVHKMKYLFALFV